MAEMAWGLLGPERLPVERRVRTLGLGKVVRSFNDLAVPGLGGVWFGKQLFLATLGVALAEGVRARGRRAQNIETANAVEAVGCWGALDGNGWSQDPRLRGATKMQGREDLSFSTVRKRGFYVTQPMRMSTVQPLPALGLVRAEGTRFNAFTCTQAGHAFIEAQCAAYHPCYRKTGVFDYLGEWTLGGDLNLPSNDKLRAALSPLEPLAPHAREIVRERVIQGGDQESVTDKKRRRAALSWVESLRNKRDQQLSWQTKPVEIDDAHWADLRAGAAFFVLRDAAIAVLDRMESHIGSLEEPRYFLNDGISECAKEIEALKLRASEFLGLPHTDKIAAVFCRECLADNSTLMENLVRRDERVLRLRGQFVVPGPAFRGKPQQEEVEEQEILGSEVFIWPEGISQRVSNLFLLNLDIHGELSEWLGSTAVAGEDES